MLVISYIEFFTVREVNVLLEQNHRQCTIEEKKKEEINNQFSPLFNNHLCFELISDSFMLIWPIYNSNYHLYQKKKKKNLIDYNHKLKNIKTKNPHQISNKVKEPVSSINNIDIFLFVFNYFIIIHFEYN
jgi:hypothetical protein